MKTAYDNFNKFFLAYFHKFSNIAYKTAYSIYKNNFLLFFKSFSIKVAYVSLCISVIMVSAANKLLIQTGPW